MIFNRILQEDPYHEDSIPYHIISLMELRKTNGMN